ncbi:enhancer of mRNA-decapping protein 4-like [Sycon ciliatum]|uniref:enhancer of mRNA-decapping protein 4-like n=1 Tax=Sycon ciliatum TaxID=27933 RepID=UPI0031F65D87
MELEELTDEEQIIGLTGEDRPNGIPIASTKMVKIVASSKTSLDGSSTDPMCASSLVKNVSIANQSWEQNFYDGVLVASNDRYFAYAVRGKNGYMVRVINQRTSTRTLLKGLLAPVADVAFAHASSNLIGCVDSGGNLFIWELSDAEDDIQSSVCLIVHSKKEPNPDEVHRLVWSPHVPIPGNKPVVVDDSDDDDDGTHTFLGVVHGCTAVVYDVEVARSAQIGDTPLAQETILAGITVVDTAHEQNIYDLSLSPDAAVLASCGGDGLVRFWQVDQATLKTSPHCLHTWSPHDGARVSSIIFCDDRVSHNPDRTFWRFVVTAAESNRVLKIWCTVKWECLQTISFEPESSANAGGSIFGATEPRLQLAMDSSASFFVLSDITRKVLYVLHLAQDGVNGRAQFISVAEFVLSQPVLSFSVVDVILDTGTPPPQRVGSTDQRRVREILRLCCLQPKEVQELNVHLSLQQKDSSGALATSSATVTASSANSCTEGDLLSRMASDPASTLDAGDSSLDHSRLDRSSLLFASPTSTPFATGIDSGDPAPEETTDNQSMDTSLASNDNGSSIVKPVPGEPLSPVTSSPMLNRKPDQAELLTPAAFATSTGESSSLPLIGTSTNDERNSSTPTITGAGPGSGEAASPLLSSSALLLQSSMDGSSSSLNSLLHAAGSTANASVSSPLSGAAHSPLSASAQLPAMASALPPHSSAPAPAATAASPQSAQLLADLQLGGSGGGSLPLRPLNPLGALGGALPLLGGGGGGAGAAGMGSAMPLSSALLDSMSLNSLAAAPDALTSSSLLPGGTSSTASILAGQPSLGEAAAPKSGEAIESTLDASRSSTLEHLLTTAAGLEVDSLTASAGDLSGEDVIVVEEEVVSDAEEDSDVEPSPAASQHVAAPLDVHSSGSVSPTAPKSPGERDLEAELNKVLQRTKAAQAEYIARLESPVTPAAVAAAAVPPDPSSLPLSSRLSAVHGNSPELSSAQQQQLSQEQRSVQAADPYPNVAGADNVYTGKAAPVDSGNDDNETSHTPSHRRRRARARRAKQLSPPSAASSASANIADTAAAAAAASQDGSDGDELAPSRTASISDEMASNQTELLRLVRIQQDSIAALGDQLKEQEIRYARQADAMQRLESAVVARAKEDEAKWSQMQKERQSEKQRQQSSATQLPSTVATAVQQKFEKGLKTELKSSILPAMERQMSALPKQTKDVLLSGLDAAFTDSLSRAVKSKAVTDALGSSVVSDCVPHVQQALRSSFDSCVIPAVQGSVSQMFNQLDLSMKTCAQDYVQQVQAVVQRSIRGTEESSSKVFQVMAKCENTIDQQLHSFVGTANSLSSQMSSSVKQTIEEQVAKSMDSMRDALLHIVKQEIGAMLQTHSGNMQQTMSQMIGPMINTQVSRSLADQTTLVVQQVTARLLQHESQQSQLTTAIQHSIAELTEVVKAGQAQTERLAAAATAAVAAAGTSPKPEAANGTQVQAPEVLLQQLVDKGDYQQAFMDALSASNIGTVVYLCKLLPVETIFPANGQCHLSQQILLSLIQQLSSDLGSDIHIKLNYLSYAVSVLDSTQSITSKYGPRVMQSLCQCIDVIAPSYPELQMQFNLLKTASRTIK